MKAYIKFIIGIAVLIMVALSFFMAMKSGDLENGTLRNWLSASEVRRAAAVEILTGGRENAELVAACLNKMATLPDSGRMKIKDAASLCLTGITIKENI
jgi:hypothetical protein